MLHTIATLDTRGGGPPIALAGMASAQAAAGMEVTVVATWPQNYAPELAAPLRQAGVRVEAVGPGSGPLMHHPKLRPIIRECTAAADVVHVHGLWEEVCHLAAVSAEAAGKPYVITPHGMLTHWSLSQKRWKKRLYMAWRLSHDLQRAAAVHYISRQERDSSKQACRNARAIVEPIGINLHDFEDVPARGSFRKQHPQMQNRKLVLFLGRIHPGKGLEYLVPAMAHPLLSDAMLVIVGPDSDGYRAVMERKVSELRVSDRVMFTGPLMGSEKRAALVDADIFCLPSDHENFGLAVVESLAAGTPVVISQEVAIHREIVEAGVGAAIERDPAKIAAELSRWLSNETMRNSAAARCRAFVRKTFDWNEIVRRWVDHYQKLCEGGAA